MKNYNKFSCYVDIMVVDDLATEGAMAMERARASTAMALISLSETILGPAPKGLNFKKRSAFNVYLSAFFSVQVATYLSWYIYAVVLCFFSFFLVFFLLLIHLYDSFVYIRQIS